MTKRPALGCLLEIVETLVLTLIIFFVIQTFVAQPYRVQQVSMERTLEPDQYVLVDKLTPRFDAYKRGDIVVFNPPQNWVQAQGQPYIKRVIGIGGDTVELKDGKVLINGTALLEQEYVYQDGGESQPTDALIGVGKWVVPTGQLFIMGDHRSNSADSREFGPVDISAVIGRAWLRYWPLDTFGVLPKLDHAELDGAPGPAATLAPLPSATPAPTLATAQ